MRAITGHTVTVVDGTRSSGIASHHHRVGVARLVVPAPHAHRLEAVPVVEVLRGPVVHGDLQQDGPGPAPVGLGEQRLEQGGADPLPLPVRAYREVLYPRLAVAD